MSTPPEGIGKVTGLVLAGGMGRRMGSVDKGLQPLHGKPMVQHVIERLVPQVDTIIINANRNLEAYEGFGLKVVPDAIGGYAGPLAGLHAGMGAAQTEYVATAPCDSPFLPRDLVSRLRAALDADDAIDLAVAKTGDQAHPVFVVAHRALRDNLAAFLEGGGRKIDAWYAKLGVAEVSFDDEADAFRNINTPEELREA
jgi:molybdopterin-guanine dinucleotide biosynthesis protein A